MIILFLSALVMAKTTSPPVSSRVVSSEIVVSQPKPKFCSLDRKKGCSYEKQK